MRARSGATSIIASLSIDERTFYISEKRSDEITSVVDCSSKENLSHVAPRVTNEP